MQRTFSWTRLATMAALAIGTMVLLLWWLGRSPAPARPPTSAPSSSSLSSLRVGEEGRLDNGGNLAFVAVDDAAFDALNKAANAGDQVGIADLITAGRVFTVSQNTRILVIENGIFSVKIRVTDGPQQGKSGWVPAEFVKP